jgi:hypothetical protein
MMIVVGGGAQIRQVEETGRHVTVQEGGGATTHVTTQDEGGAGMQHGVGVGAVQQGVTGAQQGVTGTQQTGVGLGVGALGGRLITLVIVTVTCCCCF